MSEESIERTLGRLLAEVRSISKKQDDADTSRKAIYDRIDQVRGEVRDLSARQASLERTVADTKIVTDEVKRWKLMGFGALSVVGVGGAALGVAMAKPVEWLIDHVLKGG